MRKKNDFYEFEILDWEAAQNPKNKEKNYQQLIFSRFRTGIIRDPKILRLSNNAKLIYLFLWIKCGEINAPMVQTSTLELTNWCPISNQSMSNVFKELEQFQLVNFFQSTQKAIMVEADNLTKEKSKIAAADSCGMTSFIGEKFASQKTASNARGLKKIKFDLDEFSDQSNFAADDLEF